MTLLRSEATPNFAVLADRVSVCLPVFFVKLIKYMAALLYWAKVVLKCRRRLHSNSLFQEVR
jgi:hypothetical protein